MRLYNKVQVLKVLNQHLIAYPTPANLNWNWNWGSLAGLLLSSQIITGILLAMHLPKSSHMWLGTSAIIKSNVL